MWDDRRSWGVWWKCQQTDGFGCTLSFFYWERRRKECKLIPEVKKRMQRCAFFLPWTHTYVTAAQTEGADGCKSCILRGGVRQRSHERRITSKSDEQQLNKVLNTTTKKRPLCEKKPYNLLSHKSISVSRRKSFSCGLLREPRRRLACSSSPWRRAFNPVSSGALHLIKWLIQGLTQRCHVVRQ